MYFSEENNDNNNRNNYNKISVHPSRTGFNKNVNNGDKRTTSSY
jgi:hypothetical protein